MLAEARTRRERRSDHLSSDVVQSERPPPRVRSATSKPVLGNVCWLLGLVLVLFSLYVVALGPLTALYTQGYLSEEVADALEAVYSPLKWAYDRSPTVQSLIDSYLLLWVDPEDFRPVQDSLPF